MPHTATPDAVADYLSGRHLEDADVVSLTGDASDRRYYRVHPKEAPSFIIAVHAAPFAPGSLPFVNVAQLFEAMPVPIPRVLDEAADLGILALDDLGDVTLQSYLAGDASPADWIARYEEAVAIVGVIQRRGRELADSRFIPYAIAFDVDKLQWELDFFLRHFLESYLGLSIEPDARERLRAEFAQLAGELAAEPRVLCHRDFHSRNLMLHDSRLFAIDFQDARMGPDTYDLVSLLRDSYVDLPEDLVSHLIDRFAFERGVNPADLRRRFDAAALQRNLKALGTFGYQATARNNPVYAQYVPRTLRLVRDNLRRNPRFEGMARELSALIGELGA